MVSDLKMDEVYSSRMLKPSYKFSRRTTQKTIIDTLSKRYDDDDDFFASRFKEALLDLMMIWGMNTEQGKSAVVWIEVFSYDAMCCVPGAT
jgi:hypothetical protein